MQNGFICKGNGSVDCSSCRGSSRDNEGDTCSTCEGSGTVDCSTCDGTGQVPDPAPYSPADPSQLLWYCNVQLMAGHFPSIFGPEQRA